jgi:hypothetical protein
MLVLLMLLLLPLLTEHLIKKIELSQSGCDHQGQEHC